MTTKRLTAEDLATIEAWANAATVAAVVVRSVLRF